MKTDVKGAIGRLYGVGVGPGDPELLTLKAHRILSRVPVVFVPRKDGQSGSYAKSIISGLLKPEQEVIELVFPMTRNQTELARQWQKAADSIWEHLQKGKDCAFVNLGDPLLYGTFIYLFQMLQTGHPELKVEVVPGISSVNAAAARAVVPLASADERVAIVPANAGEKFIRETLENFDTVVLLKIHTAFDKVLSVLEQMELIQNCVYVRRCTTQDEEIVRDIRKLRGEKLDYFSLLIVRR